MNEEIEEAKTEYNQLFKELAANESNQSKLITRHNYIWQVEFPRLDRKYCKLNERLKNLNEREKRKDFGYETTKDKILNFLGF